MVVIPKSYSLFRKFHISYALLVCLFSFYVSLSICEILSTGQFLIFRPLQPNTVKDSQPIHSLFAFLSAIPSGGKNLRGTLQIYISTATPTKTRNLKPLTITWTFRPLDPVTRRQVICHNSLAFLSFLIFSPSPLANSPH